MAGQLSITPELSDYIRETSLREDDVLRSLRAETAELPGGEAMQVLPEEGQLLGMLVGVSGARTVVEVGTFTGYSTLCMARALPPGGRLITCDISPRWAQIAESHWALAGVLDRIDMRIGDAVDTLAAVYDERGPGSVDFVFIDADKPGYPKYFEAALSLLSQDGLIVIDNTLYLGRVADPSATDAHTTAICEFNSMLRDDPRIHISMLPVADGITLVRKNAGVLVG